MRDCRWSEELRTAFAAEEPLAPTLAAHVAACAECTRIVAAANRFESRLDAAVVALVTDALPPSTAAVARTAPVASRNWSGPRIFASAIVALALGAFAVVGLVTTGTSISDVLLHGSAATDPGEAEIDSVDCYLGEPIVDVVAEGDIGAAIAPDVVIAYCFEGDPPVPADGERGITCLRSRGDPNGPVAVPRARSDASDAGEPGYLAACTRVADAGAARSYPPDAETAIVSSAPLASWDEARAAVTWSVRAPGWLPAGYDLVALQGFAPATDPQGVESVVATYLHRGMPLSIEQFAIADPAGFRIELTVPGADLDTVTTGRTTVGGHAAFWADGVRVQTFAGPGVDVDTMVLAWSDGRVGYRITARDSDLDELRRIAASLDEE